MQRTDLGKRTTNARRLAAAAAVLTMFLALPALAYLLPSEMAIKYAREPWKGTEPFRISAKHTITRPNLPPIQTTAEIDFGTGGQFRFADKAPEGSLLVRDGKNTVEMMDGKPVQPAMDLYGFRWLFMPTAAPPPERVTELRQKGFLLAEPPVQMLVDRLLVRGLQVEKRRLTACPDRKRPCFVIGSDLALRSGDQPRSELWLDAENHRPEKWIEVRGTAVIEASFENANPARFGGFPGRIVVTAPGIEHIIEAQELVHSPKLPPDLFSTKLPGGKPDAASSCPAEETCKPAEAPAK